MRNRSMIILSMVIALLSACAKSSSPLTWQSEYAPFMEKYHWTAQAIPNDQQQQQGLTIEISRYGTPIWQVSKLDCRINCGYAYVGPNELEIDAAISYWAAFNLAVNDYEEYWRVKLDISDSNTIIGNNKED